MKEDTEEKQFEVSKGAGDEKKSLRAEKWFDRGLIFQQNKNLEKALRCYHKVIRLEADQKVLAITHSNLSVLLIGLERYAEAESALRKAIELNPLQANAYYNLGLLLYEKLERYDEAESAYRKAIEVNPSYAVAYNNLGVLLAKLERYNEAEAAYRKAIELNPSYASAYYNLGNLLKKLDRYAEAESAYRKANKLDLDRVRRW